MLITESINFICDVLGKGTFLIFGHCLCRIIQLVQVKQSHNLLAPYIGCITHFWILWWCYYHWTEH